MKHLSATANSANICFSIIFWSARTFLLRDTKHVIISTAKVNHFQYTHRAYANVCARGWVCVLDFCLWFMDHFRLFCCSFINQDTCVEVGFVTVGYASFSVALFSFFIFTLPAVHCSGPFSFLPHLRAHSSYKRWTHKRIITIRIKNKPLAPNDEITAKLFVLLPVTKIKTYIRPFIHQSFDFKILTTSFYCLKRKKVAIQISKSSSTFQASYFYQKDTKRMSALPISYGSLPGNFKIKAFTLCVFKWKIRSENALNKKFDWPTCISLLDFLFLTIPRIAKMLPNVFVH